MSKSQFERKNPTKPAVVQHYKGGMWWAQVHTADGKPIMACFFNHADALAKAFRFAAGDFEDDEAAA